MWQFFSAGGVSIPAENVGKHNLVDESTIIYTSFQGVVVPVSNQAHVQYQALKVNAKQLIAYAKYLQNK